MYERMLDKSVIPTMDDLHAHCGEATELFDALNTWLGETFETEQKIVFPYGNKYGWGIAHRRKNKLLCNVFAERDAYTVMLRLSDKQFASVYDRLQPYAQNYIDHKYPCGDGGWIHYRVINPEQAEDIRTLLDMKCRKETAK